MTDDETDRFIRNMRNDKDDSPLLLAITFILEVLGLLLIIIGAIWAMPAIYQYNNAAGLAYIGVVMFLFSKLLQRL